jgi:octopine/nopaline transport system permease protein
MFDFAIVLQTLQTSLSAAPITLLLVLTSFALGIVLAGFITVLRRSDVKLLRWIGESYVFFFRGTPLLVQLFILYYGIAQFAYVRESFLWIILREPLACAIIALALNAAGYMAEMFRGGIDSVATGQTEAAKAFGFSSKLLYLHIVGPQAFKFMLPQLNNQIVFMVKNSALASIITVMEITGSAKRVMSDTFAAFEVFTAAGLVYLAINAILTLPLGLLNQHLSQRESRAVQSSGSQPMIQ